ncbi:MAG: Uma2 family endonuclease [Actinomycetota bacterium]
MAKSSIDLGMGSFTYADLERLTDDERSHYELSYGTLVVTPAPNTQHQLILGKVVAFLERNRLPSQVVLPEAELLIQPDLVKRPDVQVVDEKLVGGQCVTGTPDLVVEILSPATRMIDLTEKRTVYEQAGIQAYWLIDPETLELTVLELDGLREGRYVHRQPSSTGRIEISVPVTLSIDPTNVSGGLP